MEVLEKIIKNYESLDPVIYVGDPATCENGGELNMGYPIVTSIGPDMVSHPHMAVDIKRLYEWIETNPLKKTQWSPSWSFNVRKELILKRPLVWYHELKDYIIEHELEGAIGFLWSVIFQTTENSNDYIQYQIDHIWKHIKNMNKLQTKHKWISVGQTCIPRFNISKYITKDEPTQLFDWMITNFDAVINILKLSESPHQYFSRLIREDKHYLNPIESDHLKVEHMDDVFVSIHDMDEGDHLSTLTSKFIRRYQRLIEYIQNYNIVFIWFEDSVFFQSKHIKDQVIPSTLKVKEFFRSLKSIGNKDYSLVIVPREELNITHPKVMVCPVKSYERECEENTDAHWKGGWVDWEKIFQEASRKFCEYQYLN